MQGWRRRLAGTAMAAAMVCCAAKGQLAGYVQAGPAAGKAPVGVMSARQACLIEKEMFPHLADVTGGVRSAHPVRDGLDLQVGRHKEETVAYGDITKTSIDPGVYQHVELYLYTNGKRRPSHFLQFFITQESNDRVRMLERAINTLAEDARQGQVVICSDDPKDYSEELAAFQVKTAAWRALAEKPKVGDEVYKDRLLAEDAVKNQDLGSAARYYEAGVAAEPTWEQGWYNAALVYAELNDYFDAAQCMKHYVILMPNAPDAQAAKDNIILWEAKAPQRR